VNAFDKVGFHHTNFYRFNTMLSALYQEDRFLLSFHFLCISVPRRLRIQQPSRRKIHATVVTVCLFLLLGCCILKHCDSDVHSEWSDSEHLSSWYTAHDLCVMTSSLRNISIEVISSECEGRVKSVQSVLLPQRCRVGNNTVALIP